MFRYVLRFCKKDYMRFISHLDLQRLFTRSLRRADIKLSFSQGFNPHPKISIVEPLSLGYESESEYLEIETERQYDTREITESLNLSMPDGIKILDCREFPPSKYSLSSVCEEAVYEAVFPVTDDISRKLNINGFLGRDTLPIMKRDKKTKSMVLKDVKPWVNFIEVSEITDEYVKLLLSVRCATNQTVNPSRLLQALAEFCGYDFKEEVYRIKRIDCYVNNISLFDSNESVF